MRHVSDFSDDAQEVQLRVVRDNDTPQPAAAYANHLQVTFTPEDFTMYFGFYASPPLTEAPPKTCFKPPLSRSAESFFP